ncbi:site-specific DNA-methyltransferase [Pseudoprevotella muciniphila]|uniref:site-specific DNA-methyltransferase (adenine-specific) n=1 Tax=Pseudoprevotella muciniphila TaxID=2133944 RepID=A0A5P8E5R9_9BACT|nr:site-specific DNA-methyltransferase [Pseudoprevotella muciniphila]QFQ12355.1 site-specific DNA-methyltransferase [Pseudoprevotella muciniphila]
MKPKHIGMQTPDGAQLNLDALYQICPSCFTEVAGKDGKPQRAVDWDKLRALLGDAVADGAPEVYDFTWVGKRAAQREAAAPTRKTLRPCPKESVDWENTQNLYIEGDNLEVLKLLQNSYMGKVKMIYIDPPYNTGNDFVYHDDFHRTQQDEDEAAGVFNEAGERMVKNTESNGKFHSDWCSMIYSRLMISRSLLCEDGVIFISIDDNEQRNLKNICDEVFGEHNYLAQVVWERAYSPINLIKHFSPAHDYILVYAKNIDSAVCNGIPRSDSANERYSNPDNDPRGVWKSSDLSVGPAVESNIYPIITPSGRKVMPPSGYSWRLSEQKFNEYVKENRIWFGSEGNNVPSIKRFLSELRKQGITPMTFWRYEEVGHSQDATQKLAKLFDGKKYFDYPKPVELLKRCVALYSDTNTIVLDFFSGSATTAHAVMQLNAEDGGNRKFILAQLPEGTAQDSEAYKAGYKNICEIGKERIRRAGAKIKEEHPEAKDLDIGFRVFKCEDSNYKDVAFAPKDYTQDMLAGLLDNIKEDRTDLDLLFDCMLRWGVELSMPLSSQKVDGCTIHNVNDGDLVACFDGNVTEKVIDAIAALSPVRVVFRDSSFNEAANKMNLFELFKQKCDWTDEEVKNNVRVI